MSETRNSTGVPEKDFRPFANVCKRSGGVSSASLPLSPTPESPSAGAGGKPAPPAGAQRPQGAGGATAAGGRYVHKPICQQLDIAEAVFGPNIDDFNGQDELSQQEMDESLPVELSREEKRHRVKKRIAKCLFELGRVAEARRVASCGQWMRVRKSVCDTEVMKPIGCHHLLCPDCNLRRVRPLQDRLFRILSAEKDLKAIRFMTLTVPSVKRIDREYVDGIINAFRKLRRQDVWKCCIQGGFYSIETTWTLRHGWHVHIHALISFERNVPGVTSSTGWHYPSWLVAVKKSWNVLTGSENLNVEKVVDFGVLQELCKYTAKAVSFNHTPALVGEYCDAFADVRRLQGWGTFMGDKKKYPEPEDESQEFCKCGGCRPEDWRYVGVVHVSETILLADGTRLLNRSVLDLPLSRGDVSLN